MNRPSSTREILSGNQNLSINAKNDANVNVNNYFNNKNIHNVNVDREKELLKELVDECGGNERSVAEYIANKLNDQKSLNYYIKMAGIHSPDLMYACLIETLKAIKYGSIRSKPGGYFTGVLKNKTKLPNERKI